LDIIFAVSNRDYLYGWGWTLAAGILELLLGIMLFTLPTASITVILVYFVGFGFFSVPYGALVNPPAPDAGSKGWGWALALGILCTVLLSYTC